MLNPLYVNNEYKQILEAYLEKGESYNRIIPILSMQPAVKIFLESAEQIIEKGNSIIEAKKEDFDSESSRKNILLMHLENLNFFIKSGTLRISLKGDMVENSFFSISNKKLLLSYIDKEKGLFAINLETDSKFTLKEDLERLNISMENQNKILDLLSVMMYYSVFKKEKERVSAKRTKSKKSKKNPKAESFSIIRLNVPVYDKSTGKAVEKKDIGLNNIWSVRGHWRNQSSVNDETKERYNKLKWIDSYWKGSGKEIIQKIYKV